MLNDGTLPASNRWLQVIHSSSKEHNMAVKRGEQIVETTREARQAERGPTVRNVLVVSIGLVIVVFAASWLMFFSTQ
jgi:hypothetical protein